MNETLSFIQNRRSCRSFLEKPVEHTLLEMLAHAAACAPTARNRQLCRFTVVQQREQLEALRRAVGEASGRGESYNFYGADALILCSAPRDNTYAREDCACAMENILLSASALSLGAVWINQFFGNCDDSKVREALRSIEIPEDHLVFGSAAIGYPASEPAPLPRTENVVLHLED